MRLRPPNQFDGRRRAASVASQVRTPTAHFHANGRPIHHALVPDPIMTVPRPTHADEGQRDGLVAVAPAHQAVVLIAQLDMALSDLQGAVQTFSCEEFRFQFGIGQTSSGMIDRVLPGKARSALMRRQLPDS
jgi:hypothetical protein